LNFGAFLGFMGVNAAVIWSFWIRQTHPRKRDLVLDLVVPSAGFLFCLVIWLGLSWPAKIAGSIWLVIGFTVLAGHTRRFREPMVMTEPAMYE
jgi:amino acid transporter